MFACGSSNRYGVFSHGPGVFGGDSAGIGLQPRFATGGTPNPKPQRNKVQCPAVNPGSVGTRTATQVNMTRPGWQVINAGASAYRSLSEAQSRFPNSTHNGPGDAWRHFRWSFSMTRSMDARAAADFANSHEVSSPNPASETAMDLHNNAMGRAFGSNPAYSNLSPNDVANLALRSGCLQTSTGQ